jgi:hypothetical protein
MALSRAVSQRVVYKAHTVTGATMDPDTEAVLASDPAATGGQELRRVTSTLNLQRSSFAAQEVAAHLQTSYLALGGKRVTGNITGELSPKTYQDFMAAVARGSWSSAVAKSNTEFTSVTISSGVATVGASTWAAQGYRVGDVIRFTNLSVSANNSKNFLITALSSTAATLSPSPTDNTSDTAFNVTTVGRKVFMPETSQTNNLFAIEHYWADVDLARVFSECAIGSMSLSMPSEGLVGVDFGVLGRGMTQYATGSSPFFSSPTAALTTSPLSTVGGRITVGGTVQGIVTGATVNIDNQLSGTPVAFQNFLPAVFSGKQIVTGELQMYFEDDTHLTSFINETEVEVALLLTDDSSSDADFVSIFMPRVKFMAANFGSSIEGGVPITLPFTALKKATTTGYDATTISFQDSQSA